MNDDFITGLRQDPSPSFAEALKLRLDSVEQEETDRAAAPGRWHRWRPALIGVATLVVAGTALALPSVRASARGLLEVFRVKRFAAVPVDMTRLEKLHDQQLDLKMLFSEQIETLEEPGPPQVANDVAGAAELAGFPVFLPSLPPEGSSLSEVSVRGGGSVRATLDTEKLGLLARALEVGDLDIPSEWNGARVSIRTSPTVLLRYTRDKAEYHLLQSRSPEVELPEGIDLPQIGAIGLQLAGMSSEEAQLFARKIDWRTTLLVPVPAVGGNFRDVQVGDSQGLLVTVRPPRARKGEAATPRHRSHSVLLWSKGDRVFALQGPSSGMELLQMASSISPAGS